MPTPAEQVNTTFANAQNYATAAMNGLTPFTTALNAAVQANQVPTISFSWTTPTAPTLPSMPSVPTMPVIEYQEPDNMPGEFLEVLPGMAVDTAIPPAPTLEFPDAPVLSYGLVPTIPTVRDVAVPEAPTVETPELPTFLTLTPVSFAGVNLHEDWLAGLAAMPTLDLLEPTPYSYAHGPEYTSEVMDKLKAKLSERLNGGTGLPAHIEQMIFGRAVDREVKQAQANIDEVMRTSENLGYHLPPGVVAVQLRQAQKGLHDRVSELSRDIAIKQAELEQSNMRETITVGVQLESQLIDYSYKLEALTFEASKIAAENALAIYNGALEKFKALLQAYQTYTGAYKTLIDAELAKVEVYKAQLAGEQTKADINKSLVEQYKAQIDAGMSTVEIYRAQVGAAQTLIELEQARIGAAGEQVKAYVSQVNAETLKVEAYKATVQAEGFKGDAYKAQVDAYSSHTRAQSEVARVQVSRYEAVARAKAAEWDGYRAKIEAEATRLRALGQQSAAQLEGFKAHATSVEAQANNNIALWNASVTNYQKGRDVLLQTQKINSDNLLATRAAQLDAAKAGAQVHSQLVSSAWSMMNVSASVSGNGSTSVSYSYNGDVSGTVAPLAGA
jgi:hypothetical protein